MRLHFLLSAVFALSILNSCSSVYMPNVPNTPMLSSRSELHAAGHISLKGNVSFNSAYAVSDNIAIMLNGSIMNRNQARKDFKHNLIETGLGYYTTFGPENKRILEVYGGFGKGNSERVYSDNSGGVEDRQEFSLGKKFVQVNYSSKRENILRLFGARLPLNYGTALRISHVYMKDFQRNGLSQTNEDNIFLEPVFFTRMAVSKAVQLQYTSGSNFGLRNRRFLSAGNSVFSLGIVVNTGAAKP